MSPSSFSLSLPPSPSLSPKHTSVLPLYGLTLRTLSLCLSVSLSLFVCLCLFLPQGPFVVPWFWSLESTMSLFPSYDRVIGLGLKFRFMLISPKSLEHWSLYFPGRLWNHSVLVVLGPCICVSWVIYEQRSSFNFFLTRFRTRLFLPPVWW